jgi:hypothetical protein
MTHRALLAAGLVWFVIVAQAEAADTGVPPRLRVARVHKAHLIENCSAFYDPYYIRGFGWGSGPGLGVGFGTFEGALPQYPSNSFPNWYGACVRWGHYSATGTAR